MQIIKSAISKQTQVVKQLVFLFYILTCEKFIFRIKSNSFADLLH